MMLSMNTMTSDELRTLSNDTVCEHCHTTLGEHKGWSCVKGPKYFRLIADTTYKGELINTATGEHSTRSQAS